MEKKINYMNFIFEFKRNIKLLIIVGLVGALLFSVYSYNNLKKTNNGVRYASTGVIYVPENEMSVTVDTEGLITTDNTERNRAIILSDDVLERVLKQNTDTGASSLDELRRNLYITGTAYGTMMNIIMLSDNQDKSDGICQLVLDSASEEFRSQGIEAEINQEATAFGPANVQKKQRTDSLEKTDIVLTAATGPIGLSLIMIIKWIIKGGFLFALMAYCLVCAAYVIKGKIVYVNELIDEGFTVIGIIKKNLDNRDLLISNIEIISQGSNLIIANCDNSNAVEWLPTALESKGKTVVAVDNIFEKPLPKQNSPSELVLVVKSNTVTIRDIKRIVDMYARSDIRMIGVIFVE